MSSSEDKAEGPEAASDAKTSEAEAALPADRPEAPNSNRPTAERNQSSSPKNEESNETKVPTTTTTTIETESRENESSYVASDEAAKSEDLKGTNSSATVESVSERMNNDDDEGREKDVEKFGGKIVYNPDGSAYIIDDDNEDGAEDDDAVPALQDGSIVERSSSSDGGGKDGVSYPQIANAVYISNRNRNHAASYYSALCARIQSKDNSGGVGGGGGGAMSSQGRNSALFYYTWPN